MNENKLNIEKISLRTRIREILIIIAGWLIPGMGHLLLKKYGRALLIFLIINYLFFFGIFGLKGRLYATEPGNPISIFATLGQKGVGITYFVIKSIADKQKQQDSLNFIYNYPKKHTLKDGLPSSPYYEYGITFTVSAGLLNLLILFDVFDILRGRKK